MTCNVRPQYGWLIHSMHEAHFAYVGEVISHRPTCLRVVLYVPRTFTFEVDEDTIPALGRHLRHTRTRLRAGGVRIGP